MGRRIPAALSIAVVALAAAYFAPLGDFAAANPLPGQEWMKQHTGLALGVFALVTLLAGALAWQRRERAQDALTDQAFDPRADGYLDDLRKRMKVIWIDEFLSQSLERIVPAKLGFAERRDAITGPLRVVGTPNLTGIVEIFNDERTARRLLVLGAPGAGKTTQLLRLAEHLLAVADGPVPIVLSLSGGRDSEREIRAVADNEERAVDSAVEWLAWEIGRLYQLPPKRVERWLQADRCPVVLLLDGLDEIRDADDRRRYVDVLSLLRSRLNAGMVVCSRIDEYLRTGNRLEFGAAVQILPLRPQDVDEYLSEAGTELASLREACRRNGRLVRLLNTPLTLTVAVLTYRGKSVDEELVRELIDNRLDHLWVSYLAEALPRQRGLTGTIPFSDEDSLRYARGLARLLESAGRDSFRGDEMKLFWLKTVPISVLVRTGLAVAASAGVAVFVLALLVGVRLVGEISTAVLLIAVFWHFRSVKSARVPWSRRGAKVSARWRLDWPGARAAISRTSLPGLLIGLLIGAAGAGLRWPDFLHGMLLGLVPGLCGGVAAAVLALPTPGDARTALRGGPVSAGRRTLLVRLGAGAASLTVVLAAFPLSTTVAEPLRQTLLHATLAVTTGIWLAEFTRSMHGWWSHSEALRQVVRSGMLPRDVNAFLKHTDERIITRRKVDGHAFLHRTLQSHLAGTIIPRLMRGRHGTRGEPPAARPGSAN